MTQSPLCPTAERHPNPEEFTSRQTPTSYAAKAIGTTSLIGEICQYKFLTRQNKYSDQGKGLTTSTREEDQEGKFV